MLPKRLFDGPGQHDEIRKALGCAGRRTPPSTYAAPPSLLESSGGSALKTIPEHCAILMNIDNTLVHDHANAILAINAEQHKAKSTLRRSFDRLEKKSKIDTASLKVLRNSNGNLQRQVVRKDAKIEKLQAQLAMMTKQAFGPGSDTLNSSPAPTAEEEADALRKQEAEAGKAQKVKNDLKGPSEDENPKLRKKAKKKKGKGRQPRKYGEGIKIEDVHHGPATCPCGCGGTKRLGKPIEELITIPAHHVLLRHETPTYRCRLSGTLKPLLRDKKLFPGKSIGGSTIAYFVALKFDMF